MSVLVLTSLLSQLPFGAGIVHLKPLPVNAKISVQNWIWDSPAKPTAIDSCPSKPLTDKQVRKMFATYHLLNMFEEHDHYSWYGCAAKGTVTVYGKSFKFMARIDSLLSTEWPDGQSKPLGGRHSSNPEAK